MKEVANPGYDTERIDRMQRETRLGITVLRDADPRGNHQNTTSGERDLGETALRPKKPRKKD